MKRVDYDAVVIKAHALVLYRQAKWMKWWGALRGGFVGLLLAFAAIGSIGLLPELRDRLTDADIRAKDVSWMLFVFPVLGAARGWTKGDQRGWYLRLAAQQALCQVQIEENTRAKT